MAGAASWRKGNGFTKIAGDLIRRALSVVSKEPKQDGREAPLGRDKTGATP